MVARYYVEVLGPRPRFPDVCALLAPGDSVDTDGNAASADDTGWTELYCAARDGSGAMFDISEARAEPLTLVVTSEERGTAARVALFLATHMKSAVLAALDGPALTAQDLGIA